MLPMVCRFDALIRACDQQALADALVERGFTKLVMQARCAALCCAALCCAVLYTGHCLLCYRSAVLRFGVALCCPVLPWGGRSGAPLTHASDAVPACQKPCLAPAWPLPGSTHPAPSPSPPICCASHTCNH